MQHELIKRRDATSATLEAFRNVDFTWESDARATCAHLLHKHLTNTGHNPPAVPEFHDPVEARRAMKAMGFSSLGDLLDSLLERRPAPAFMRMGDVALTKGEGSFDAVLICAGPFKLFGWREDKNDLAIIDVDMNQVEAVWAV